MLEVGQKLEASFPIEVVRGGASQTVAFSTLLTRPTVVSVYMRNQTPGCDSQIGSLIEHAAEIEAAGWNLIALSRDASTSHLRYAAKRGITFPLVSDRDDAFAKATGSLVEKTLFGKKYLGPLRAAWLLDTDGTVRAIVSKVDTKRHGEQLLPLLRATCQSPSA